MKFPEGHKGGRFLTTIKELDHVAKALKAAGLERDGFRDALFNAAEFREIDAAAHKDVVDFLNALDDHDDVHHVYAAMK